MKIYLKILLSTLAIQIFTLALGTALVLEPEIHYSSLPVLIVVGYVVSLGVDIYLAVKCNDVWYKKVICVLLMPTNYTPIGLFWFAMYCFVKFFRMLRPDLG